MRRSVVIGLMVLASGCHNRHQPTQNAAFEAAFQKIRSEHPGLTERCLEKIHNNGPLDLMFDPDCYAMLPPQRWSGLWESGWEWTNFCPDPANVCPSSSAHGGIWLVFAKGAYPKTDIPWGLYRLEFVGRRTKLPGHFGHQSQYDHLMVVDRVIAIKKIPGEKYSAR